MKHWAHFFQSSLILWCLKFDWKMSWNFKVKTIFSFNKHAEYLISFVKNKKWDKHKEQGKHLILWIPHNRECFFKLLFLMNQHYFLLNLFRFLIWMFNTAQKIFYFEDMPFTSRFFCIVDDKYSFESIDGCSLLLMLCR